MFWKLSLPMEPLIFTFYFTVEGCSVYVTIELFPHIDVMMAESIMNSSNRDMQGPPGVNTFLKLFNYWPLDCLNLFFSGLSVILPLLLEILFHLNYQTRTTNILIKYCNVFFIGLLLLFCEVQPLFLVWIGFIITPKAFGYHLKSPQSSFGLASQHLR